MSFEKWETVSLGEISEIQTGPFGSSLHASDYVEKGIPCIMPTNIGQHLNIVTSQIARVKPEDVERLKRHKVIEGDVVYSRRGDVEKCALIKKEQHGWLCGTGCLKVRFDKKVIDPEFGAYYLSQDSVKTFLTNRAVGATMPNLNTGILGEIPISLPPLATQRRIAALLTALDDKIEMNRRMNETLEGLAQAVWGEWFGGYLGGEELPEGWREGKLGEFGEFKNGVNYGREDTSDTEFKIVSVKELVASDYILPDNLSSIPMDVKKAKAYLLKKDDIVIVRSASPGETALMVRDFPNIVYSGFAIRFRPNDAKYKFYLFYLLQKVRENLDSLSNGTTLKNINQELLTNFECNYPPQNLIDSLNKMCEPIMDKIYENHIQSRTLTALRDALLPRLMSGELAI